MNKLSAALKELMPLGFSMLTYGYVLSKYNMLLGDGISMLPTIEDNGVCVVDKTKYRKRRVKVNDIVICTSPVDREVLVCKRVVGVEGSKVYVQREGKEYEVEKNQVWLEGDNKNNSFDSRMHGPVDKGLITGVVMCKIYPSFKLFI